MNEKVGNFIFGFLSAIATALGAVLLCNLRKSANTVGDNDRQSAELTERVGREIEDLGSRTEQSKSDYSAAKQTIAEIKSKQKVVENNSISG